MEYKYIFGPVPSRRFGFSLGIDAVPLKICTLNCLYCECGKTTNLTIKRDEYIKYDELINEIKNYLINPPKIDVLTITGSGEPTLNINLGKIINFIKSNYSYKTVLLTNGSLLYDAAVREEIKNFDIVKISLDAFSEDVFNKINKPERTLNNKKIIDGIVDFRKIFTGKIWIEIFILPDINDNENELSLIKDSLKLIKPDKIQLNTIDRPPAFSDIKKADKQKLEKIKELFLPFDVDIIGKFSEDKSNKDELNKDKLISILKRRPLTIDDIEKISGEDNKKIKTLIDELKNKGLIKEEKLERGLFYLI